MAHRALTALELHEAIEEMAKYFARDRMDTFIPAWALPDETAITQWEAAARTLSVIYGTSFEDTRNALMHRMEIEFEKLKETDPRFV